MERLASETKKPEYATLMKNLIVQGLIKIEEQTVEIIAKAEDKAVVAKVVSHIHILLDCVV